VLCMGMGRGDAPPGSRGRDLSIHPAQVVLAHGPIGMRQDHPAHPGGGIASGFSRAKGGAWGSLKGSSRGQPRRLRPEIGHDFPGPNLLRFVSAPSQKRADGAPTCCGSELRLPRRVRAQRNGWRAVWAGRPTLAKAPTLSGGQKHRVAIARRALAAHPRLLWSDELHRALDSRSGRDVWICSRSAREQGCAVLLLTHDPRNLDVANAVGGNEEWPPPALSSSCLHLVALAWNARSRNGFFYPQEQRFSMSKRRNLRTEKQDATAPTPRKFKKPSCANERSAGEGAGNGVTARANNAARRLTPHAMFPSVVIPPTTGDRFLEKVSARLRTRPRRFR